MRFIEKYSNFLLMLFWVGVQLTLYCYFGFVTGFEGAKYLEDAQIFNDTFEVNSFRVFYLAYPLIILFFLKLKIGLWGVLAMQLIVNALATYSFYLLTKLLYNSNIIQFLLTVSFIFCFQIQMWNFFLFTESFFTSGLIILTYLLMHGINSWKKSLSISLLFITLSFIRPNGVLLILPIVAYYLFNIKSIKNRLQLLPVFISIIVIFGANIFLNDSNLVDFVSMAWQNAWIIWGYDSGLDSLSDSTLLYGAKLIGYRLLYYFSMERPYFSDFHNILIISYYPIYLLSVFGIYPLYKKNLPFFTFLASLITIYSVFTVFTFINWHGRFIVPILPFFILLSGAGLSRFIGTDEAKKN